MKTTNLNRVKKSALLGFCALSFPFIATFSETLPTFPDPEIQLEEFVITGTRAITTTQNLPLSVNVLTNTQLENRMEQSVLPLLMEQVPSLFITSRGVMGYGIGIGSAGSMTMRGVGGSGSEILVLIDGHPQFMGLMGHPIADSYQNLMTERVEVVRGPASVLYGSNAMGGVINIITREQREDGVNTHFRATYGSYNTFSAEAMNKIRSNNFSSVLSLGYNRSDGHRPNMNFEQFSGYGKVSYNLSQTWRAVADLKLTQFSSADPGFITEPMTDRVMDVRRGITSLSFINNSRGSTGAVRLFYNFGRHYINDGIPTGSFIMPRPDRFNSKDWMFGANLFQNYRLFWGNVTTLGIDFKRYGGHAWNTFTDDRPNADMQSPISSNNIAGYLNFQQRILDNRVTINGGIRFDYHSRMGGIWVPQAGLNYFVGRNTTLSAIVSRGFRNPSFRELYILPPHNPELIAESLMNYEISVTQFLFNRSLRLEANVFYIKGRNSIVTIPRPGGPVWGENRGPMMWENMREIENFGVEFTANYRVNNNLSLNANYSFLHMKYEVISAPEHKLYVGLDYRWNRLSFSTGLQYVHNLILATSTPASPTTKESFLLWNARATFQLTNFMDLHIRGENLLNQSYSMFYGYPMPGATVFGGFSMRF